MDNIVVISQNVKLSSLSKLRSELVGEETLVVSTQFIFENEAEIIEKTLECNCVFKNFSDLLDDSRMDYCDTFAYNECMRDLSIYYNKIRELKNGIVAAKVLDCYPCENRIILCDDLGLDVDVWRKNGFRKLECEYYYTPETSGQLSLISRVITKVTGQCNFIKNSIKAPIWETYIGETRYLFYGSMNRIGYRIDSDFKKASKWENIKYILGVYSLKLFDYFPSNKTIRMSTLHESVKWKFFDHPNYNLKLIQDGYLPPNYPSKYLLFDGKYTEFYTWDILGQLIFKYHNLPSRPMPFRKKLYLPTSVFPTKVKKVLCVASGAGDWTAVKNRSDEDKMIHAFGKVAAMFPDIEFIYRCHPVWVHPQHQGVNSIVRAAEYIDYLNLPNFKISCNIPAATDANGNFILSYKRSSFEDDLKDVDIVFGEHSVSMIDAAFKSILFGSVNVTGRRDFFEGVTKLGFPHCESVEEIVSLIQSITSAEFKESYENAVRNYNEMTDKEH